MRPYTPIVPPEVLAERAGLTMDDVIKLDGNENPYGCSPRVGKALSKYPYFNIYPDPEQVEVRMALSAYVSISGDHILAGAGSDELIDLILRLFLEPGDGVVNCPPTFGMYPFDADVNGARTVSVPRQDDFSPDLDGIREAVAQHHPKLIFVASPNNPDGSWLSDSDLEQMLALPLVVVLDEAYVEFAGVEHSRITMVPRCENLIVLRSFSKWAGLAGLRVGYGAFPIRVMPHLWKVKQPYNVPVASAAAAIAVLGESGYLDMHVARMCAERERLTRLLAEIPYLHPYPSRSTYVLCRVLERDAHLLKLALEDEGILIRHYATPRLRDHIRISIGRPEQTDRLIAALKRI